MSTEQKPDAAPAFQATPGAPCWLQIPAYDVSRAVAFYQAVLDFAIRPSAGEARPMKNFHFPGTPLAGALSGGIVQRGPAEMEAGQPPAPEKGMGTIYFYVEDLEGTLAKVEKAGGKPLGSGTESGGGRHADFVDTEGNVHGVYTMSPAPEK